MKPVAIALCMITVAACGSSNPCQDVYYGGVATDEALRSIVDGESLVKTDDAQAPNFTAPAQDTDFPATGAAPSFAWTSSLRAALPLQTRLRLAAAHPRKKKGFWRWLEGLFVSEAWAHLPPVTSDIYYLEFSIPGSTCHVRALTTDLNWQVSQAAWKEMGKEAGKTVELQITSAYLRDNRITEGPFRPSQRLRFRVVP